MDMARCGWVLQVNDGQASKCQSATSEAKDALDFDDDNYCCLQSTFFPDE